MKIQFPVQFCSFVDFYFSEFQLAYLKTCPVFLFPASLFALGQLQVFILCFAAYLMQYMHTKLNWHTKLKQQQCSS